MIAWSIEKALNSNCFDKVIVSTDCKEIRDIAKYYGAEVPFLRQILSPMTLHQLFQWFNMQ